MSTGVSIALAPRHYALTLPRSTLSRPRRRAVLRDARHRREAGVDAGREARRDRLAGLQDELGAPRDRLGQPQRRVAGPRLERDGVGAPPPRIARAAAQLLPEPEGAEARAVPAHRDAGLARGVGG